MKRNLNLKYWSAPCRVAFRTKTGVRIRLGGYGLVARMRDEGRLIGAWCTSTGKALA
jgi:hypothetical protein